MCKWLSFLLVLLLVSGCAFYSDYYKGRRALGNEDYDQAISLLQKASEKSPNDSRVLAELGFAYFKKDNYQRALEYLEQAKSVDPTYNKTYLYLGMVYENQDDYQKAISEYNTYYQQSRLTLISGKVKARIAMLTRQQIESEIKASIQQEESLPIDSIPQDTIAVSYFSNITGDENLDPLQKGLTDMVINDLSQVKSLKVLERVRLQVLINEMGLEVSNLIEQSEAPRFGKLLGARRIINGGIALSQKDLIRIDALATNIVTAETDAKADVAGEQDRFFLMEKELVFDILDDLQIPLTAEEREAIQQRIPTRSFVAFLAYSRGLDYEDRGLYQDAADAYQRANRIDPGFSQAGEKLLETRARLEGAMAPKDTGNLERDIAAEEALEEAEDLGVTISTADRLDRMNINAGVDYVPQEDGAAAQRTPPQQEDAVLDLNIQW
jgi:tetratricopeptide (TPR) repeat protein